MNEGFGRKIEKIKRSGRRFINRNSLAAAMSLAAASPAVAQNENYPIEVNIGYSTSEMGELNNVDVKAKSLSSRNEFNNASRLKGFRTEANKYLNTHRGEYRVLKNGNTINPDGDYFYIPKEEIDGFLREEIFDENGNRITDPEQIIGETYDDIDHRNLINSTNIYLNYCESNDGRYYIIPNDLTETRIFLWCFKMPEQVKLTKSDIRESMIPTDYKRAAEGFGLAVGEYIDARLGVLEALNEINLQKGDIQNYDLAHPEGASFALSAEEKKEIENNFIDNLKKASDGYSEQQKLVVLATLGDIFLENYDEELRDEGVVGGELPLSEFLLSAKANNMFDMKIPRGVCRHINQKLPEIAEEAFGMRGLTKSTYMGGNDGGLHVIGGIRLEDGTIAFIDYGQVIKTGTPDLQKAASLYERYQGRIEGLSIVGDAKGDIKTYTKSRATESREEAIHFKSGEERLPGMLSQEKIFETKDGLRVTAESEKQEIEVSSHNLVASFVHLDESTDPYNALERLYGVRVGGEINTKHHSFHMSTSLLAEKLKGLDTSSFSKTREFAVENGWDYLRKFDLTESSRLVIANSLMGYCARNLSDQAFSGLGGGDSFGLKFAYINPDKPLEFHVGVQEHVTLGIENIQIKSSDIKLHSNLTELDVATRVQVSEKLSVGLSTAVKKGDVYEGGSVGIDVNSGGFSAKAEVGRQISDDVLFLPHSATGEIELEEKIDLSGRSVIITLYGSQETKDYGQQKDSQLKFKAGLTLLF